MSPADIPRVHHVGKRLMVMPNASTALIAAAHKRRRARFPGAVTPTEGLAAPQADADRLKIVPAQAISPTGLKVWRAVFAYIIPLLPNGGIAPERMVDWRSAGASGFGIRGNLYRPRRSLDGIRANAEPFVGTWKASIAQRASERAKETSCTPTQA